MSAVVLNCQILPRCLRRETAPSLLPVTLKFTPAKAWSHTSISILIPTPKNLPRDSERCNLRVASCLSSPPPSSSSDPPSRTRYHPSTRLYVSGLSFRTTEESLRNAFKKFGELIEVNLVMDNIALRPKGFAFLRYTTEEESKKAIEGMHGKFLDGRVIFVEVARPRSDPQRGPKQKP